MLPTLFPNFEAIRNIPAEMNNLHVACKKNANGFGTKQTQASHIAHTLQFPHRRFTSHHLRCIMKAEGGNLRQALKKTFNFRGLKSLFEGGNLSLIPILYWTFCKIKRYSSKLFDLA